MSEQLTNALLPFIEKANKGLDTGAAFLSGQRNVDALVFWILMALLALALSFVW